MGIPNIKIKDHVLTISLTLEDITWITETRMDATYKVVKPDKLLSSFKFHLENYQSSNATELGISELQVLIDKIIDEIVENADDVIDMKELKP